jgi:hypothetical protein
MRSQDVVVGMLLNSLEYCALCYSQPRILPVLHKIRKLVLSIYIYGELFQVMNCKMFKNAEQSYFANFYVVFAKDKVKFWILHHLSCPSYLCILLVLLCQTRTDGVVDVVYVNIVTWTVGCKRVGELARVRQLFVDQGQEWTDIRHHEKRSWFSK